MKSSLLRYWRVLLGVIVVLGVIVFGLLYVYWDQFVLTASLGINYVRYMSAPAGTIETQANPAWKADATPATFTPNASAAASEGDWPSYNRR